MAMELGFGYGEFGRYPDTQHIATILYVRQNACLSVIGPESVIKDFVIAVI